MTADIQNYNLKGKIVSLDKATAKIQLEDGQTLNWPTAKLPDTAKTGDEISLSLATAEVLEQEEKKVAKSILNILLGN